MLNNNNRKSCFEVKIFNDKEIEDDEVFGMVLSFNTTSQSLISLQPNTTYITIVDDDDDYGKKHSGADITCSHVMLTINYIIIMQML